MPTLLFLVMVLGVAAFFLLFFLRHGLGGSLRLAGYLLLAASLLSFLFFLSIDPGYGWTSSPNLRKNHIVLFIFIALFILSIGLIVVGRQMATPWSRPVGTIEKGTPARGRPLTCHQYSTTVSRIDWTQSA